MIEKLEQIDEILASYEDWMHGEDGEKCTMARRMLIEVMKEVKNISFKPMLADSCPTCGHSPCLCRVPLGNFR